MVLQQINTIAHPLIKIKIRSICFFTVSTKCGKQQPLERFALTVLQNDF